MSKKDGLVLSSHSQTHDDPHLFIGMLDDFGDACFVVKVAIDCFAVPFALKTLLCCSHYFIVDDDDST